MASTKDEVLILEAAGVTTSQTSQTFTVPSAFNHLLIYVDVTAGSTLLIDFSVEVYLPGPNEWLEFINLLPSADAITGVAVWPAIIGASAVDSTIIDKRTLLGGKLRVVTAVGNANAATYDIYIQPV